MFIICLQKNVINYSISLLLSKDIDLMKDELKYVTPLYFSL